VDKLSRIPFTVAEEDTISSMARWMRFIAMLGIIGGILMLVLVVLGIGLFSTTHGLGEASPKWAEVERFLASAGPLLYVMLAAALLMVAISLWQNFALYNAGDFFNRVARTDVADVDYLSSGLDRLRLYFKIQVRVVVVAVVVGFVTAFAMIAVISHR
jgi:hypothetical protein